MHRMVFCCILCDPSHCMKVAMLFQTYSRSYVHAYVSCLQSVESIYLWGLTWLCYLNWIKYTKISNSFYRYWYVIDCLPWSV